MSVDVLQQKKEEVAQSMLDDFKKELGFFQSTILSFFDKKITQAIITDAQIGSSLEDLQIKTNFIEKFLIKLSPAVAEKVFLFIKEKQEQLIKAKTVEELENLKKWIIVPPEIKPENQPAQNPQQVDQTGDQNIPPTPEEEKDGTVPNSKKDNTNIIVWVGTGAGLWLSAKAIGQIDKLKTAKKLEATAKIEDPNTFLKKFEDLAEWLKKEKLNPKLTNHQVKMIDKSIKEFQKISKDVDSETFSAVKMLEKLDKKLPNSLLKSIDPSDAKKLGELISSDADFVAKLTDDAVSVETIQNVLKNKWIKNINENVIKWLRSMKWAEELQGAVHILTKLKGIRALTRWMRGVILLDLAFTWFDIWTLMEWLDGAELSEKVNQLRASTAREHQRVQFGASLALTAISIIITCSAIGTAGWPIGTAIGALLWVLWFAASQAIDVFYDAVEFYEQNPEDFKQQYRTEIKQSIIQSAASEERNLNFNSRMYASAKKAWTSRAEYYLLPFGMGRYTSKKEKLTTTGDAWRSLIWQEEYSKFPSVVKCFNSWKSEEEFSKTLNPSDQITLKKEIQDLNTIVDKRMEYVKNYMYEKKWTPEYISFVAAMKNNLWISAVERVLTDSKVYYQMGKTNPDQYVTGAKNVVEYKKQFGEKLQKEYPDGFATLEKIWSTQPSMVSELYQGVKNTEGMFKTSRESPDYDKKDKIPTMQKNLELIKKYYEYKLLSLPVEQQKNMEISFRALDARMIEGLLISWDFTSIGALSRNKDQVKNYFAQDRVQDRRDTKIESSDKIGQNIIYRIAREIHWYEGHNTMSELIEFFREDKWAALWLYYSNWWKINNDWAIDKSMDVDGMENMSPDEIMKMRVKPSQWNQLLNVLDPVSLMTSNAVSIFGFTDDASRLDTKADAGDMDNKMNVEYWNRLRKIVYEEKSYTTPEIQKKIETAIIDYVKKYSQPVNGTDAQWNINPAISQTQGYIEMPYYLIIAAKKAKIGNIEKFLFKYENNQVIACTTKLCLTEKLDFSQTKTDIVREYVSGTAEKIGENAQKYLDYVDVAKKQFETLITFDVDDLDIPKEYLEMYKKKITERETLKQSLLSLDSITAKAKLKSKYQEYHDYFENTYIAMLQTISKFKINWLSSNDLDSSSYHQQIEFAAAKLSGISIDSKWTIVAPIDQLTKIQKKSFDEAMKTHKIDGKTIPELAKSTREEDKEKAIRATKQIIKSIVECEVLRFDKQGNIVGIFQWETQENKMSLELWLAARLDKNAANTAYFDPSKYEIEETKTDDSKIEIKTLDKNQEKTEKETNEVQKIIEATQPDLIYPGRGLVVFDPETNILTSWGKNTKIDAANLTIAWLTTTFASLKELVMVANLANRFKYKYSWTKDFYFGSRLWLGVDYGIYKPKSWTDTQILDLHTIKEKFPNILTADNDVKPEFISYINSL